MKIVTVSIAALILFILYAFRYLSLPELLILAVWFAAGFAAFRYLLKP